TSSSFFMMVTSFPLGPSPLDDCTAQDGLSSVTEDGCSSQSRNVRAHGQLAGASRGGTKAVRRLAGDSLGCQKTPRPRLRKAGGSYCARVPDCARVVRTVVHSCGNTTAG